MNHLHRLRDRVTATPARIVDGAKSSLANGEAPMSCHGQAAFGLELENLALSPLVKSRILVGLGGFALAGGGDCPCAQIGIIIR